MNAKVIQPQEGFQYDFLSTSADIAIGGGSAGAGKTFALLLEPLRHVHLKSFGGVFFRRTYPQIKNEGGLWDTAKELYSSIGAISNESNLEWRFPTGAKLKFSHIQYDKNVYDYQGAQIPFIAFDELTHFTEYQFFYLLSRNRSVDNVSPYVRATCNPDPESWVARLLEWWINQDTGFPIAERAGVLRYFIRDSGNIVWGDTKDEVIKKCPHIFEKQEFKDIEPEDLVKSLTFIPGTIYENKHLMSANPDYLGNLLAQDEATKSQLLEGNWKIKIDESTMINYQKIHDCFFSDFVKEGKNYITADIAMHGSDKFVLAVWSGLKVIELYISEKTKATEIESKIKEFATKYKVPRSHIVFDADGIGAYLGSYLVGAVAFNNGASPIRDSRDKKSPNYKNLKTQCFYELADAINNVQIFFAENVGTQKINHKLAKDLIIKESRAIKRLNPDADGKLQIISKLQMKNILGHSPDIMDALMMRMYFELKPAFVGQAKFHFKSNR